MIKTGQETLDAAVGEVTGILKENWDQISAFIKEANSMPNASDLKKYTISFNVSLEDMTKEKMTKVTAGIGYKISVSDQTEGAYVDNHPQLPGTSRKETENDAATPAGKKTDKKPGSGKGRGKKGGKK